MVSPKLNQVPMDEMAICLYYYIYCRTAAMARKVPRKLPPKEQIWSRQILQPTGLISLVLSTYSHLLFSLTYANFTLSLYICLLLVNSFFSKDGE